MSNACHVKNMSCHVMCQVMFCHVMCQVMFVMFVRFDMFAMSRLSCYVCQILDNAFCYQLLHSPDNRMCYQGNVVADNRMRYQGVVSSCRCDLILRFALSFVFLLSIVSVMLRLCCAMVRVMLCYGMLCYATSCYVMLCVMFWCLKSCHVMYII